MGCCSHFSEIESIYSERFHDSSHKRPSAESLIKRKTLKIENEVTKKLCICGGNWMFKQSFYCLLFKEYAKCDKCKENCSIELFYCDSCSRVLCVECGLKNASIEMMFCDKGHRLEFLLDCPAFRFEYFNEKFFSCEICGIKKIEPSWSCKVCDFHYCLACCRVYNIGSDNIELTCHQNHPLFFAFQNRKKTKCLGCFKTGKREKLFCEICEFALCFSCAIWKLSAISPFFLCNKGHFFYLKPAKTLQKKENLISCLKCRAGGMKVVYHCEICEQSLCMECFHFLTKLRFKKSSKTCLSNHVLVLGNCKLIETVCSVCLVYYEYPGFNCGTCKFSLCANCI